MPMSSDEMIKLYLKGGWKITSKKKGKGSHTKLEKKGRRPQIIPYRKELGKGLEIKLKKEI